MQRLTSLLLAHTHIFIECIWKGGCDASENPYELSIQLVHNCNKIYDFIRKNNNNFVQIESVRRWWEREKKFFKCESLCGLDVCSRLLSALFHCSSTETEKMCKWQLALMLTVSNESKLDSWILRIYIEMLELITFSYCSPEVFVFNDFTRISNVRQIFSSIYATQERKKHHPQKYDVQHLWHQPKHNPNLVNFISTLCIYKY